MNYHTGHFLINRQLWVEIFFCESLIKIVEVPSILFDLLLAQAFKKMRQKINFFLWVHILSLIVTNIYIATDCDLFTKFKWIYE